MIQEIAKKLNLKPGWRVLVLNAQAGIAEALQAQGMEVDSTPAAGIAYDAVQVFATDSRELNYYLPMAEPALKRQGLLWVAYPKKSSGIKSDLNRDAGWEAISSLGYAPVRQVAIDDTWSSLRFKHESERSAPSKFGVDAPGIDRKNRTVEIPQDLREALESAGLLDTFEKLAFTHRKEHVLAILEAKRPETRSNRIGKTIQMLMGQQLLGR
ncbi:YdeI/OmpD-associated family protein [Pontibacter ramchanderi]|uniref:Bacteriocin resistance YdeI/OmpD-like protein n=1 Tax=Pontibacter ramchanderi TaxID=1179743 RepID=A0A2N3UDE3_9BACT|nr:YdeI/OmpD-associated family protein [Pontibacter ramchanderi]PKV67383.1 bacteriocin resistance YdeI/OmpD-like protein [Pontibacter ramchanderi]